MFTLCMSRGHPPLHDRTHRHNLSNKQIKGGYLLRYRRGFFCKSWCEEWFVLYEDSTLEWYSDKGTNRARGRVRIAAAPDLLAVGEWTRQVPKRPRIPHGCHIGQMLAVGSRGPQDVQWLMAQSPAEVADWMTAISNTLPPPPHLPLEDKRLSLTTKRDVLYNQSYGRRGHYVDTMANGKLQTYDNDHTVLSGVVIDWGHGWGWGQSSWAAQTPCTHEMPVSSSLYCHTGDDYTVGGIDEVDWSAAFGDFGF